MHDLIGLVAGVVGLAGYAPYVRDILAGKTQPERTSWLIWTLEYAVLCAAQLAKGAGPALWLAGLQFVGVIIVYALSFKYGTGRMDRRNAVLLVCVCLALSAWFFSSDATLTIWILIIVEAVAGVLTAIKVYRDPGSETLTMWVLLAVAGGLGVFAIAPGNAAILYLYPIFLVGMGGAIVGVSKMGSRQKTSVYNLAD
ncbi:MAG TPA: hypothetical protein VJM46_02345 [Candidatus Saccharimonadales bacterium]|nr:hypothetical protein [Candidatus Saccharimonadales bacterium]